MTTADRAWKRRIANSFGRVTSVYDQQADVQRTVARKLADRIAQSLDGDPIRDALEIGCGTGFLTRIVTDSNPDVNWTISDMSPAMVDYCRSVIGKRERYRFQVLDGEQLEGLGDNGMRFDLICSNLAFQWFSDLPTAVAGIMGRLKPGGHLIFSTLAEDNFSNVYESFQGLGLRDRANSNPGMSVIQDVLTVNGARSIEITKDLYLQKHDSLGDFLNNLKALGAATSRSPIQVDPSKLRSALIQSRQSGEPILVDYRVLFVVVQKETA